MEVIEYNDAMASLLKRYKKAEIDTLKVLRATCVGFIKGLIQPVAHFFRVGREQITVLVVYHSEKPPRGRKVSRFALALMTALLIGLPAFAVYSFVNEARVESSMKSSDDAYAVIYSELSASVESANAMLRAYKAFAPALEASMAILPASSGKQKTADQRTILDPFSLFSSKQENKSDQIQKVTDSLDKAVLPLTMLGQTVSSMNEVKTQVPAIWPIKADMGHLSTTFGSNPNPFTGQTYFHKGIDCSTYRSGDPIVATADGHVTMAGYSGGYGYCVIIAHPNGYYTRYGHMSRILVQKGQAVSQGQTIGLIGNTGNSTGPHVHYEVMLDGKLIDPLDYLWTESKSMHVPYGDIKID